ncbi:MAG: hypothetical protein M1831_005983 [Alyxoria varia]|nr:MAG: hypothetical protein M1831_005983 [Alyxoria varia]
MHGPRGYGDAVTYNSSTLQWASHNLQIHLDSNGLMPDASDVGRIWNEGLAFWGWLFYLSKFYEVVDTIIILLKGKRSSTLQTFHHAGAMLSVWAGIRFMSPPIWMFVLVNSGLHAIMYTYYALSTLGVQIPRRLKRTLTVLQILQLIVGSTYAACHLFVSYTIPVSMSLKALNQASATFSAGVSAASAAASKSESAAELISSATTVAYPWVKKFALYAAGAPNVADKLFMEQKSPLQPQPAKEASAVHPIGVHRTAFEYVQCLDTDGQVFAIWLNVLYLAPLTGLFVRFFIKAYGPSRLSSTGRAQSGSRQLPDAAVRAAFRTSETVDHIGTLAEENAAEELGEKAYHGTATPQAEAGEKERIEDDDSSSGAKSEPTDVHVEKSSPSDPQFSPSNPRDPQAEVSADGSKTLADQDGAEKKENNFHDEKSDKPRPEEEQKTNLVPSDNEPSHDDAPTEPADESEETSDNEGKSREQSPSDAQAATFEDTEPDQDGLLPNRDPPKESQQGVSEERDLPRDSQGELSEERESYKEPEDDSEQELSENDEQEPMNKSSGQALDGSYDLVELDKKQGPAEDHSESESSLQDEETNAKEDVTTKPSLEDIEADAREASEGHKEVLKPSVYGEEASNDEDHKENVPPESPAEKGQDDLAKGGESQITGSGEGDSHERSSTSTEKAETNGDQEGDDDSPLRNVNAEDEKQSHGSQEGQAENVRDDASEDSVEQEQGEEDALEADSSRSVEQKDPVEQNDEPNNGETPERITQDSPDVKHTTETHDVDGVGPEEDPEVQADDGSLKEGEEHGSIYPTEAEPDDHNGEEVDQEDEEGQEGEEDHQAGEDDLQEGEEDDQEGEEEVQEDESTDEEINSDQVSKEDKSSNVLNTQGEGEDIQDEDLDTSSVLSRPNA